MMVVRMIVTMVRHAGLILPRLVLVGHRGEGDRSHTPDLVRLAYVAMQPVTVKRSANL